MSFLRWPNPINFKVDFRYDDVTSLTRLQNKKKKDLTRAVTPLMGFEPTFRTVYCINPCTITSKLPEVIVYQ